MQRILDEAQTLWESQGEPGSEKPTLDKVLLDMAIQPENEVVKHLAESYSEHEKERLVKEKAEKKARSKELQKARLQKKKSLQPS